MAVYEQIDRSALADALVRNLDGQPCEDLTPTECEEAMAYARVR